MRHILFIAVLLVISHEYVYAQSAPQWENLQRGKYDIGYKTLIKTDYSRRYGNKPRVIQIYIWYPAVKSGQQPLYEQYFKDIALDLGTDKTTSSTLGTMLERDFRSGALNPSFPGRLTNEAFGKILKTPVPAVKDALPAAGKFPLVLHISSNGALHQSVMLEYLASHGFVMMSISMYGSSPAFYGRGEAGAKGLHVMTEDLAFAISQSRTFSFIDTGKTAMVGMMAQAGISLQMKEELLDAVVCHDCHVDQSVLERLTYYEPRRVRIKTLQILNSSFPVKDNFMIDSLIYSERFTAKIQGLQHPDFYPFPRIASPETANSQSKHDQVLQNTLSFLQFALQGKPIVEGTSAIIRKYAATEAMPTEAEFLEWLRYGNMEAVRQAWKKYGKEIAGQENFFSVALFLARDKAGYAREVFDMYSSVYSSDTRLKMISQFF